jgi:hypothetical protein
MMNGYNYVEAASLTAPAGSCDRESMDAVEGDEDRPTALDYWTSREAWMRAGRKAQSAGLDDASMRRDVAVMRRWGARMEACVQ